MDYTLQTISICLGIISTSIAIGAFLIKGIIKRRKERHKEAEKLQEEDRKAIKFIMKVTLEILSIMAGKEINGEVKDLLKESIQFNIDN